jgi:uncharacterized membrane protein
VAAPAGAGQPQQTYSPPGGQGAQQQAATGGLTENVASALCYLLGFITGIIFLVVAPYNQNRIVRFHAFQSIFLSVAIFAISIALTIVSTIFFAISFWLGSLFGLVHLVFGLGIFILWLYMMWKAYQGEKVVLPVVGPLAEKQA